MYRLWSLLSIAIVAISGATYGQEFTLTQGWRFYRGDDAAASRVDYDDRHWQIVEVPHDWAITGPFDRKNDLQTVAVTQNYETTASVKTGRTGGLPYTGTGWYRRRLDLSGLDLRNQRVLLYFDGVMSESRVYVNGQEVAYWPMDTMPFMSTLRISPVPMPETSWRFGRKIDRSRPAGIAVREFIGMSS